MAHSSYNCCAICDCKMDFNEWDARTKEDICGTCLKGLRALGVNVLDAAELLGWMKEQPANALQVVLRFLGYSPCFAINDVDDAVVAIVGEGVKFD